MKVCTSLERGVFVLSITLSKSIQKWVLDWKRERQREKKKRMWTWTHTHTLSAIKTSASLLQLLPSNLALIWQWQKASHVPCYSIHFLRSSPSPFHTFLKNALRAGEDFSKKLLTDSENYSAGRGRETRSSCSKSSNVQISLHLFLGLALPTL